MDSLVKVFLLQELSLNCDGFISSVYFYKDADGKMFAGPIWDQDMTFGIGWTKTNAADIEDYHYLAKALIQIPAFKTAVVKYYSSTFAPAWAAMFIFTMSLALRFTSPGLPAPSSTIASYSAARLS